MLFVIDGRKALRKAIRAGVRRRRPGPALRRHKERNVLEHLPERDRAAVKPRLRRAWAETDHDRALEQLNTLAVELDRAHPGAAASLREGMEETLTVTRLGITGKLKLTLQSTNPCESMIESVRRIHRNVKHWSSGEMGLRWTAAGMLEAETAVPQGRRLPRPRQARRRDRARPHSAAVNLTSHPDPGGHRSPSPCNHHTRDRRHQSSTTSGTTSGRSPPLASNSSSSKHKRSSGGGAAGTTDFGHRQPPRRHQRRIPV